MSTIENDHVLLYCHFNKIIKELGTSFLSPAFNQKHVRNVCHSAHWYLTKFHLDRTQDSKDISMTVTCNMTVTAMLVLTSQILKYAGFTKTQKF